MLPTPDPMGRAVVYIDPSRYGATERKQFTRLELCRAVWYVVHAALETVACQRHGQVMLVNAQHCTISNFDRRLCQTVFGSLSGSIPARSAGFHICRAPTFLPLVFPALKTFFPDPLKSRFHVHKHEGKLAKYGLVAVPTTLGGTVELNVEAWTQKRMECGA